MGFSFGKASLRYRDPQAPSADAVARWIAQHGVTRCPAAACEVTTATIPAADLEAIRQHARIAEEAAEAYTATRRKAALKATRRVSARQAASVAQRQPKLPA